MKIFYSKYIPFKGFRAINLFGFIFVRKEFPYLTEQQLNHEAIHMRQIREMLFVGFYIWYLLEWLIRWVQTGNRRIAYENISFEREAYENDNDFEYLKNRPFWSFIKYIRKK